MRDPQFMARVQRVQEAASGRWLDILIDAGLPEVMLLRLNRPCPLCGGRDRFSFYRHKPDGHWFCRGCGYGDGLSLLQKWRSERFTDTLVYLERVLGLPEYKRQDTGPDSVQTAEAAAKKRRQDRIEAVWKEAQALSKVPPSDPVRLYLASRGLYCGSICELRSHPLLDYWEELDDGDRTHKRWPAMLALVTDDEGRIVTLHRTYLTPEGIKAPVEAPKKLYAGGARGGLIRLGEPSDVLGIAEGIETALSARTLFKIPVWSAVSVGGFQNFTKVPDGVRKVVVFGDNDRSYAGQAGAYALAARLRRDNPSLEIEVEIPKTEGLDWSDVWMRRRTGSPPPPPRPPTPRPRPPRPPPPPFCVRTACSGQRITGRRFRVPSSARCAGGCGARAAAFRRPEPERASAGTGRAASSGRR